MSWRGGKGNKGRLTSLIRELADEGGLCGDGGQGDGAGDGGEADALARGTVIGGSRGRSLFSVDLGSLG